LRNQGFFFLYCPIPGIDAVGKGSYGENSNGKLMTEYQMAMYNCKTMKFASFQRQLCDKCHAKD